jgi:uncharacterized protein involved in outer membrane biogenesis
MKPRYIALGAGAAVVVLAAAAYFTLTSLDAVVRRAIERYGSEVTGTAVRVYSVDISLSSGRGTVRRLTVANPEGFSSAHVLRLGEITLQIDVGSVTSSPIVIDEIDVTAPVVLFEVNQAGAANVDVIRKSAERDLSAGDDDEKDEEEEPPRLLIRRFSLRGGEVDIDATAVGGKERKAELPPLVLSDVGGHHGATPGRIGEIIVGALSKQVAAAAASERLGTYLEKKIDEEIEGDAGEAAKDLLHSLTD